MQEHCKLIWTHNIIQTLGIEIKCPLRKFSEKESIRIKKSHQIHNNIYRENSTNFDHLWNL
uniref:Uncharacterized protein n=1 Tax=Setaria italica TaxID=4555 RepID=K3ZD68_SETIT